MIVYITCDSISNTVLLHDTIHVKITICYKEADSDIHKTVLSYLYPRIDSCVIKDYVNLFRREQYLIFLGDNSYEGFQSFAICHNR